MDPFAVLIRSGTSQDWCAAFKQAKALKQPIKPLYHAYLQSVCWEKKREWVLNSACRKCQVCQRADATQVHHLTYDRCGAERIEDLQAICRPCHERKHPGKGGVLGEAMPSRFERGREWKRRKDLEWALNTKRIDAATYRKGLEAQESVTALAAAVARALPCVDYSRLYVEQEIVRDMAWESGT